MLGPQTSAASEPQQQRQREEKTSNKPEETLETTNKNLKQHQRQAEVLNFPGEVFSKKNQVSSSAVFCF